MSRFPGEKKTAVFPSGCAQYMFSSPRRERKKFR
jgi:hypothetical protein